MCPRLLMTAPGRGSGRDTELKRISEKRGKPLSGGAREADECSARIGGMPRVCLWGCCHKWMTIRSCMQRNMNHNKDGALIMHEHTSQDAAFRRGRDRCRWPEQVGTEPASDKSRRVSDSLSTRLQKKQTHRQQRKKPAASLEQQPLLGLLLQLTMMRNINHNASSKASTQIHTSAPAPSSTPNSRSDSQICTASHISVVIFAALPLLRMRPKETFSCSWTSVCVCVCESGSFCFPSSPAWHTGPGSSISAGNVTAAATATNNFDIALQSCGANIAEHWALRVLRTGCARILWNQRNGGALTCMLRKRATGSMASGQLGHKTRLHNCESNARLKYTLPSFTH